MLARPCRENAMQETKDAMSIDAMQKTKTTMNDASECVPPTPCGSHAPSRMCTHAAKRVTSLPAKQNPLPMCRVLTSDRHGARQTTHSPHCMRLPIAVGSR